MTETPFKMPSSEWLAELFERMGKTECRGERVFVDVCTEAVEAACPERDNNACPKKIIGFEQMRKDSETEMLRLEAMGVPKYAARLLGNGALSRTEAVDYVDTFLDASPSEYVMALSGGAGLGKTVAAAYALTRRRGRFTTANHLSQRRKDLDYLHQCRGAGLLVVDDLGAESLDGFDTFLTLFVNLFIDRTDDEQQTIITTNLNLADLRQRYGTRFVDRFKNGKGGSMIGLAGESMRGLA